LATAFFEAAFAGAVSAVALAGVFLAAAWGAAFGGFLAFAGVRSGAFVACGTEAAFVAFSGRFFAAMSCYCGA
jgi:hypothetical protein